MSSLKALGLFIYYETRTKVHEKEKEETTDHRKHTKRNTKKHITKNTSHGAYIVHN